MTDDDKRKERIAAIVMLLNRERERLQLPPLGGQALSVLDGTGGGNAALGLVDDCEERLGMAKAVCDEVRAILRELHPAALRLEFGSFPLLTKNETREGVRVALGNSPAVAIIWPAVLCITETQRKRFIDRVSDHGDQSRNIRDFLSRVRKDTTLSHDIDVKVLLSL